MPTQDDTNEQELYALCGRALSWAQMLEQELLNGILLHALARKTIVSRDELEDLLYRKDKQPLRHKLDEIFQRVRTEPDLRPIFYEALNKRNYFVHRFFWDRMELSFTKEERKQLLVEVGELADLFRSAYIFAKGITDLYAEQVGMTEEMVRQELEKILPSELHRKVF